MFFSRLAIPTACLLLTLLSARSQPDHDASEGLLFPSNNGYFGSRGLLELGLDKPLLVDSSFTLSFDISIRGVGTFGYIVRLVDGENRELTLSYSPARLTSDSSMLSLSIENDPTPLTLNVPSAELGRLQWQRVSIGCDRRKGETSLRYGSMIVRSTRSPLLRGDRVRIVFGHTPESLEVPPMAIRRIVLERVAGAGSTPATEYAPGPVYAWNLDQPEGDVVLAASGGVSGTQSNCRWLALSKSEWTEETSILMEGPEIPAFDEDSGRIFLVGQKELSEFDLGQGTWRQTRYAVGLPARFGHLEAVYSTSAGRVLIYHNGTGEVSSFTNESGEWSPIDSSLDHNREYYNHASFVDPATGALYTFGGYGWYTAKNALLRYDVQSRRWEQVQFSGPDTPAPRLHPMMAKADSAGRWWMAGGTGNRSGRQEARYQKLRDLWELDLSGPSWREVNPSLPFPEGFLPVSMAAVPGDPRLFQLGWAADGDSGSFRFLGIERDTWAVQEFAPPGTSPIRSDLLGLWYDRRHLLFVAVFHVAMTGSERFVVHTIQYPVSEPVRASPQASMIAQLGLILAVAVISVLLVLYLHRRRRTGAGSDSSTKAPDRPQGEGVGGELHPVGSTSHPRIELFGKFRLLDARSKDWADELPPKLRELFLYLLLHTPSSGRGSRGVTTAALTADLWPEHDAHGAKNIRGVSIKRLRDYLREVGDIGVVQDESHWRIETGGQMSCNFQELMSLLQDPHSSLVRGEQGAVERFLQIVSGGSLLAGEDYPWLEAIRADVSRSIVGTVVMLLRAGHGPFSAETIVSLAEAGLSHEPVNEELLSYKVRALVQLGRHGAARTAYDRFAGEYAEIAGRPFPHTFQECSS